MDSVIVTRGETVLGRATSFYLAKKGFVVYTAPSDPSQDAALETRIRESGLTNLRLLPLDMTNEQAIASAVARVNEETGGPFALVKNPGIGTKGFFEDLSMDEIKEVFRTNTFETMKMVRAVLPHMRLARRGRIILVTSIGGRISAMGSGAYCASKFAEEGFGESLYQELLPFGVHVSLVEPAIAKEVYADVFRVDARGTSNKKSPYYAWFQSIQALAERVAETAPTRTEHIVHTIARALVDKRPRLRYIVGRRARLVYALRRYLPNTLFERAYFGTIIRRVTSPRM